MTEPLSLSLRLLDELRTLPLALKAGNVCYLALDRRKFAYSCFEKIF